MEKAHCAGANMSEPDDFLDEVLGRHLEAVDAFHSGNTKLWRKAWSAKDPVTLFGPGRAPAVGREETFTTFRFAASVLIRGSSGRCSTRVMGSAA
jgi:hypothetical protein